MTEALQRLPDAVRISDFVPVRNFYQRTIYNEFYRKVDVTQQMSICLPVTAQGIMTCTLNRDGMDFSESECDLLTLMSPHLTSAIRNANLLERLQRKEEQLHSLLKSNRQGLIVINADGKIAHLTKFAEKLLCDYFPQSKVNHQGLPEELINWSSVSEDVDSINLLTPFIVSKVGSKLTVKLVLNSRNRTLLLEEKTELQPSMLTSLGLTRRESEVLFWIAMGKTNLEISLLCAISPRTVQKHIEHICNKLGVENRTAAAVRAIGMIN